MIWDCHPFAEGTGVVQLADRAHLFSMRRLPGSCARELRPGPRGRPFYLVALAVGRAEVDAVFVRGGNLPDGPTGKLGPVPRGMKDGRDFS